MILVCPTAFKGTLSARAAADAMAAGARAGAPESELRVLPLSDGGHGLLDALESAAGGKARGVRVPGPLGTSVSARYLMQDTRVLVETAEACGLHLVPPPLRDPMRATTRGVGELLLAAVAGAERKGSGGELVVGLGGSATVDAGAGMVTALGWRLLDDDGEPIPPGGAGLLHLAAIEPPATPPRLPPPVVLADVTNALLGPRGAAPVYAPQKGATRSQVEQLTRGLERWSEVVWRDVGVDVSRDPGTGAAGGLGAAFAAFLEAPPRRGAEWVLEAVAFDALLRDADLVVTGEGAWDVQSSMGKITGEVVTRAVKARVPVVLAVGSAEGRVPGGVELVTGGGALLTARSLAGEVEDAVRGLLAGRRRR